MTTHRSNVATTPEMLAGLFGLSSHDQGVGWVSFPGPPKGKDLSGFWKERVQGSWAGVSGLNSPRRDGSPGSSCPLSTPSFRRFQQQSFLEKMLVMATAPANSGRLWLTSPAGAGGERGGARNGTGVGLGEKPDHYSTVKVARLRAAAASWFVLRRNGERRGGILFPVEFPPRPFSPLLKAK